MNISVHSNIYTCLWLLIEDKFLDAELLVIDSV